MYKIKLIKLDYKEGLMKMEEKERGQRTARQEGRVMEVFGDGEKKENSGCPPGKK